VQTFNCSIGSTIYAVIN